MTGKITDEYPLVRIRLNYEISSIKNMLHFFLFLSGDNMSSVMGWVGSIAYLLAYLFLSLNRLKAGRPLYHLLNMIGALGLIIHAVSLKDYPNLVVNLAWGIIAVTAVVFILRKKPEQKS